MVIRPELWFQDETRIGQQGNLSRLWTQKGSRPRKIKDQPFAYAYIFGAVCPQKDTGAALIMPYANSHAMNAHLKEISHNVQKYYHAIVLMDGAGWHISKELNIPRNLTLIKLPPYSPELNPIENIWQYMKDNYLNNHVFKDYNDIVNKASNAWNKLLNERGKIKAITTRKWANTCH